MDEVAPRSDPRLLLVEDERDVAELTLYFLKRCNCPSVLATSVAEARKLAKSHHFEAAIIDLQLPDGDGMAFIQELKERQQITFAIATSAAREPISEASLKKTQVDAFLPKPYSLSEVRECLEKILPREGENESSPSSKAPKASVRTDLPSIRSAGKTALNGCETDAFIRAVHQMTNQSFALQNKAAAIAFSDAEEAARVQDWVEAGRSWRIAWERFHSNS